MENIFDVVNDLDLTTVVMVGTLVILLLGACVFTKIEEVEGKLKRLQNLHQQECAHLHTDDPHK